MKRAQLFVFFAFAILGAIITPHFGKSWGELKFYAYADFTLGAYQTSFTQGIVNALGNVYNNYGPAFVVLVAFAVKPLQIIFIESDARHYFYFPTLALAKRRAHRQPCPGKILQVLANHTLNNRCSKVNT